MIKDILLGVIIFISNIVIVPFVLLFRLPWIIKAYRRYTHDVKDKSLYTFSEYLTDVRHRSKSFNKRWREMASKGIYLD